MMITATEQRHRARTMVAFVLVYLFWGSTYLVMHVAIEHLPPFAMGMARYLISGPLMLAGCALSGRDIRLSRQDTVRLMITGVLLLTIGNMGVAWAEEYVPTGVAALVVAIVPLWVVLLESLVFKTQRLSHLGLIGLALGMAGMVVLLWPRMTAGAGLRHREMTGVGILAFGSLCWALGSVLSGRWKFGVDVFTASAWQMTIGVLGNGLVALVTGQLRHAVLTTRGAMAIAYLVVCGSWIGFSAYGWLLEHVPTPKVATYAYVNPVVAIYLGWLFLNENVDRHMLAGTVIIIGAVALVNFAKLRTTPASADAGAQQRKFTAEAVAD